MAQSVSVKEQPKTKKVTTSTTAIKMSAGAPAAKTVASVAVAAAMERAKNNGNGMSNSSHHHHHASGGAAASATTIGTKPTLIEVGPMRFLIMDAPRQANLHIYIKEMAKHQVSHVVRVCEPTYNGTGELQAAGMKLHEMEYKDGTSPSRELIFAWLKLVEDTFYATTTTTPAAASTAPATEGTSGPCCIAVHCVAGLGRAPVLVALALIELHGMDPVEAVTFLRQRRRGAINEKQLLYLEGYKKQYKKTYTGGSGGTNASTSCCVIL
jgi:protein tyrosine phosphatase type IVA